MRSKEIPKFTGALQTCRECGKVDRDYYVQPQADGTALCGDCINRMNEEYRQARKAQLAAMPRCQVPGGCKRRGTYKVGSSDKVFLCGHHLKKVQNEVNCQIGGMFWLAQEITGQDVLAILGTEERRFGDK